MTTTPFVPVPIIFGDKYEGDKLRRLVDSFNTLATRVAALGKASGSNSVPTGGTAGQVLTRIGASGYGWANPAPPTGSIPYSSLTGVPTSFAPALHLIASPTGLGSAHAIQAPGPGSVLVATGTTTAVMAPLLYSQLGDVDTSAVAAGRIPQWNGSKWVMVDFSGGYSGLTVGTVLTATSPTTAVFQPITPASITGVLGTAQLGVDPAQYGLGAPMAPLKPQHGTQYAQLNEPGADDSVLAGDGRWKAIRDIGISWSQLSDVPGTFQPDFTAPYRWLGAHQFVNPGRAMTIGGVSDSTFFAYRNAFNQTVILFGSQISWGVPGGVNTIGVVANALGALEIYGSGSTNRSASFDSGAISFGNTTSNPTVSLVGTGAVSIGGAVSMARALGVNGVSPPARVTGFGTPTGTGVIANFPGATATLAQCSQAIAQLITDIKALGVYGA